MIRHILAAYCLTLVAMFIGATVQAVQPDPAAPATIDNSVPLPTPRDFEIATANEAWYQEARKQAMMDDLLHDIVMPTPYLKQDYNSDGLLDLIREEVDEQIYVYINSNTNTDPYYEPGIIYVGPALDFPVIEERPTVQPATTSTEQEHLAYDRFDVYIEQTYYDNNSENLDIFFDQFEVRYQEMEDLTGWTSEESYGTKLRIEVGSWPGICYGGGFSKITKITHFDFSEPFYKDSCKTPYREDNVWKWNNPGELGDFWRYMGAAIHETTHAINPKNIGYRKWLTEGFAMYNQYNTISNYGDLNQETANYYLYQGTSSYNWESYLANDYQDYAGREIQDSAGYDITAWMFTMLREDYSLDFSEFYHLMSENPETLDKAFEIGGGHENYTNYVSDTTIIDLFGRALGMSFDEIKAVFRYDGTEGPGWGVREWVATDWYADLTPSLGFSIDDPVPGQTIDLVATVYNNGDTDANDFPVRFYEGTTLLDEQIVSVSANSSLLVTSPYTGTEGTHTFSVFVDEDDVKLETDETNNEDSQSISFMPCCIDRVGDANAVGGDEPTIGDVSVMIDAKFITGTCDGIIACLTEADINQSGGVDPTCDDITIGDISVLIDYLFITGPSGVILPECL